MAPTPEPTLGERIKKTNGSTTSLYPFGDDYEVTGGVTTKYEGLAGQARGRSRIARWRRSRYLLAVAFSNSFLYSP